MAFGNESCISGDTLSRRSFKRWKNRGNRVQVKKREPRGRLLLTGGGSWSADLYACAVPHDSLWYYSGSVGAAAASVRASPFVRIVSYLFPFLPFFSFMNFRLLFSTIQKPLFVQWQRANSTMAYGEKNWSARAHARAHTSPRRTNNNLLENHRTNIFFIPKKHSFIFFPNG